jgi:hypothetical protein
MAMRDATKQKFDTITDAFNDITQFVRVMNLIRLLDEKAQDGDYNADLALCKALDPFAKLVELALDK